MSPIPRKYVGFDLLRHRLAFLGFNEVCYVNVGVLVAFHYIDKQDPYVSFVRI